MTYLDALADLIRSCLPPEAEPPEDSDGLFRIYAVLLRSKGTQVTDEDVHDAWAAWMQSVNGEHPALVPFEELEPRTRAYDTPYAVAIRAAARRHAASSGTP